MKACPQCKERFGDADEFCPHHGHRLVPIVTTGSAQRGNYDRLIGTTIDGRYVVDSKLGEGGMGVVFKAHHKVIEKPVAIKVLRADLARDASVVQRFLQEAKAATRIGHANIVDVIDVGTLSDGAAYSVMEFIDGRTLAKELKLHGRLPLTRTLPIIYQMGRALAAAHDKGIVHRDLKPDNVFLFAKDGRDDLVKIVDFGIAKIMAQNATGPNTPRLTRVGAIFGTPDYMAPEQAAGRADIDQRVDIYAVGTILYELVVGHVPHRSDNPLSVLTMQLLDPITPPRQAAVGVDISDELEAVVMKALAKERDQRFHSMGEFLTALEMASGGIPLEVAMSSTGPIPVVRVSGIGAPLPPHVSAIGAPTVPSAPTPSPVVFSEKRSHAEMMPPSRSGERAAVAPRQRTRHLVLGAVIVVAVATGFAAVALLVGGGGDDGVDAAAAVAPGTAADAAPAVPAPADAGQRPPPGPADAATPRQPPDAAKPTPPIARRPDAGVRVVEPPVDKRTFTVTIVTEPADGVIFYQGKQMGDRSAIRGEEGTQAQVRCEMFRREPTRVTVTFDGDKTVVCKMAELKDPFK